MARVGTRVLEVLGEDGEFVRGLHSVGAPLGPNDQDLRGPTMLRKNISAFSGDPRYSGPTGRATAERVVGEEVSRVADCVGAGARRGLDGGHMLILKMTSPSGQVNTITGPSFRVRQDQPGVLIPTIRGWKVETVGDRTSRG